ncbi:helix-turn-helix domain-containing protein [Eikenella corrodens]|uniref:helix-turn-helix domain-containing protein n=1 Tax=Eikenella corrodens TaxID=539 RepID=UPI0028EBDD5A|nr:helix-turn-helix domain-containing protein [Eikenella corrodens]
MSMQLMAYAMSLKVGNPLRKLVLLKLADNANDKGECFPSYQHIADQCEISRRAVMGHIQALEKAGYLKIKRRKNGKENQSNVFYLTLKKGGESAALGGSELSAPPSEPNAPPSESAALGGSESGSPITSHSSEPIIEPTPLPPNSAGKVDAAASANPDGLAGVIGDDQKLTTAKPRRRYEAPISELVAIYNEETAGVLPAVQKITDSRIKAVNARWLQFLNSKTLTGEVRYSDRESGLVWWRKFFRKVLLNERWCGGSGIEWTADFDWIVKQSNFVKILEWRPAKREEMKHAA